MNKGHKTKSIVKELAGHDCWLNKKKRTLLDKYPSYSCGLPNLEFKFELSETKTGLEVMEFIKARNKPNPINWDQIWQYRTCRAGYLCSIIWDCSILKKDYSVV